MIKEVKLSPKIAQHDFDVRVEKARELLGKGHKVKINHNVPGQRDGAHRSGQESDGPHGRGPARMRVTEAPPKLEGRNLNMLFAGPKK